MSRIIEIQWLRGFAAALVVVDHAILNYSRLFPVDKWGLEAAYFFGDLGVWIFFIISGFIMATISSKSYGEVGAPARFLAARFFRVAPLYFIFTVFYFFKDGSGIYDLVLSLSFFPYLNDAGFVQPIVGQGWTLNFEAIFYVIFGVSLFFSRNRGLWFVVLFISFLVALRPLFVSVGAGTAILEWSRPPLILFLIGLGFSLVRDQISLVFLPRRLFCIAASFLIFLVIVGYIVIVGGGGADVRSLFAAISAVMIVALFLFFPVKGSFGVLGRFFELLGDASYSTYLVHGLALGVFSAIWARLFIGDAVVFLILAFVFSNFVGVLCFYFVERNLNKFFRR